MFLHWTGSMLDRILCSILRIRSNHHLCVYWLKCLKYLLLYPYINVFDFLTILFCCSKLKHLWTVHRAAFLTGIPYLANILLLPAKHVLCSLHCHWFIFSCEVHHCANMKICRMIGFLKYAAFVKLNPVEDAVGKWVLHIYLWSLCVLIKTYSNQCLLDQAAVCIAVNCQSWSSGLTPYGLVGDYQHVGRTCCLHLHGTQKWYQYWWRWQWHSSKTW